MSNEQATGSHIHSSLLPSLGCLQILSKCNEGLDVVSECMMSPIHLLLHSGTAVELLLSALFLAFYGLKSLQNQQCSAHLCVCMSKSPPPTGSGAVSVLRIWFSDVALSEWMVPLSLSWKCSRVNPLWSISPARILGNWGINIQAPSPWYGIIIRHVLYCFPRFFPWD